MSAKIITVIFLAAYYGVTFYLLRGLKLRTKDLAVCGIMVALTLILEAIRIPLPTGATMPCFSVIPLILLAVVCDYRLTFLAGWICGVLGILLIPEWQPVYWAQIPVEHMVCFSCMGYAGIFGSDKRWKLLCGILLASVLKLCGHTLSGVLFFSQDAWKGWGAWGYSLIYNVSQNVPLCILSAVVVMALPLNTMKRAVGKEIA